VLIAHADEMRQVLNAGQRNDEIGSVDLRTGYGARRLIGGVDSHLGYVRPHTPPRGSHTRLDVISRRRQNWFSRVQNACEQVSTASSASGQTNIGGGR